jgi:hypothetical protein
VGRAGVPKITERFTGRKILPVLQYITIRQLLGAAIEYTKEDQQEKQTGIFHRNTFYGMRIQRY